MKDTSWHEKALKLSADGLGYAAIGREVGKARSTVFDFLAGQGVSRSIDADRALSASVAARKDAEAKYKEVSRRLEQVEKERDIALAFKQKTTSTKSRIPAIRAIHKGKNEAAAIALASDWHVEEIVNPRRINNLNEYNPDISRKRSQQFFRSLVSLIRKERQDVSIKTLVLWLGGDFITGRIHDELIETTAYAPLQAAMFAGELIGDGLKFLADNAGLDSIILPCSQGNHGRTTKERRFSTAADNSYEHSMYCHLAQRFTDPIFDWRISEGYYEYVEAFGKTLRFSHGENIKYSGGVGGITIPAIKHFLRADQQRRSDFDACGHYHQRMPFTPAHKFAMNGSLIGYNAFAQSVGASPEIPVQSFQILDEKRGFTIAAPLIVTE